MSKSKILFSFSYMNYLKEVFTYLVVIVKEQIDFICSFFVVNKMGGFWYEKKKK